MSNVSKIATSLKFVFFSIWKCDKKFVFFKLIFSVVAGLFPLVNIYFPKVIIDCLDNHREFYEILQIIGFYFILQLFFLTIELGMSYYDNIYSLRLIQNINADILDKIMTVDLSFFEDPAAYDAYQRARNEASTRTKNVCDQFLNLFSSFISLFMVIYILFELDWLLVVFILLIIALVFFISQKTKKMSFKFYNSIINLNRENAYLFFTLSSKTFNKEIRIFDLKNWILQKQQACYAQLYRKQTAFYKKSIQLNGLNGVLIRLQYIFVYISLVYNMLKSNLSIGNFTMYTMATQNLIQSFNSIISLITSIYENCLFTENLIEFLSIENKIISGDESPPITDVNGKSNIIEFENVTFSYPGQENKVLDGFSLKVHTCQNTLLVGENGVGKTTLIKLLLRLYEPQQGKIKYNGVDIKELNIKEYRSLFGVVFQDHNKFAFSIAENVLLREPYFYDDREKIENSLQYVGLWDKVNALKNKADTPLTREFSENGTDFSVGEMQKLALARAYIRNAPILVLDEPTSALDPNAEYAMYQNFIELSKGKTGIFISHRLSCAPYMDHIILIENGKVQEQGSHYELLQLRGKYYDMFMRQGRGYIVETDTKDHAVK